MMYSPEFVKPLMLAAERRRKRRVFLWNGCIFFSVVAVGNAVAGWFA